MKSLRVTCTIAITLLAVALPVALAAQRVKPRHQHHHYQLIDIGTFGGPNSSYLGGPPEGRLLTNSGIAVGGADTPTPDPLCLEFNFDCFLSSGFKWQDGVAYPLIALPGSNNSFAFWTSDNGLVAGESTNGIDPLSGNYAAEAILWGKDGSLTDLGTLGGNQSYASAVNNRGQVTGAALNTIPDPYASDFFLFGATQVHAFRWTKSHGMQDLGTLGGTDSAAVFMNERGQIAGWSFTNSTPNPVVDDCGNGGNVPTEDPFLWTDGQMIDLGTLGGTCGQAFGLNNRGQVVGASDLAGDLTKHPFLWSQSEGMKDLGTLGGTFGYPDHINDAGDVVGIANTKDDQFLHGFLWRNGVMTDLGTLGTDPASEAYGVNSQGQVVGNTFDPGVADLRAFLWEDDGPMVNLNTLIPPHHGLRLSRAFSINDRGEIDVQGNFSNGVIHAFVLIPCDENHPGVKGCDYSLVDATAVTRVRTPQAARTPPGAMRDGTTIVLPGRLRTRILGDDHVPPRPERTQWIVGGSKVVSWKHRD